MIAAQPVSDGWLLFLPLCPSTNARMHPVRMGRSCRDILTQEARAYIRAVGFDLRMMMRREKLKPIDGYAYIDLWFILPRTNCDAHNYGKVLFDALEEGCVVTNDKYILPPRSMRGTGVMWPHGAAGFIGMERVGRTKPRSRPTTWRGLSAGPHPQSAKSRRLRPKWPARPPWQRSSGWRAPTGSMRRQQINGMWILGF